MATPGWLKNLLVNSTLTQGAIYVIRPMITYRALESGLSAGEIGLVAASYALLPVIFALQFGRWVGRIGESKFLIIGSGAMSLTAIFFVYSHAVITLSVTAALAGIAHLACMTGGQTMIALRSLDGEQNRNFGYYTFTASLGHTVGPIIAVLVAGSNGTLPRSTSAAFYFASLVALVAAIQVSQWWKERPTVIARDDQNAFTSAFSLIRKKGMVGTVFVSLVASSTQDILVVFLPFFGSEKGFEASAIGIILAIRALTSMASRFYLGTLTDRFEEKKVLSISLIVTAVSLILMGLSQNVWQLGVITFVAGFTLGIAQPMTMTSVTRITSASERAMGVSLRLTGNRFGQFIFPAAAGVLAGSLGAGAVFFALSGAIALGVISARQRN